MVTVYINVYNSVWCLYVKMQSVNIFEYVYMDVYINVYVLCIRMWVSTHIHL